jgi:hypothetical protein
MQTTQPGHLAQPTQYTHIEVVLLNWQPLPDALTRLHADWSFVESRFYRIAQADVVASLNVGLLELFEQLKLENDIADYCSRVVVTRHAPLKTPNTGQLVADDLPDWVWLEAKEAERT